MSSRQASRPVLVTGATGYVGGRLVPLLLERGWRVRAAARNPAKLASRLWSRRPGLEVVAADVMDEASLRRAADGCGAVYYLVHSMNDRAGDFEAQDRAAARNMAGAAARAGAARVVYLGGLGDPESGLSKHLRSRHEVARILQEGPAPVTHLRAGMILGSGSASFEILRYLVERLPVMITPRWVSTPCQPICIRDVLRYLAGCLEVEGTAGRTFDIGGPDVLTYRRLMEIFAEEAGLRRRLILPVPVLTPRLSSYWIHLVTPVHASIARPLAQGLSVPVVCAENRIRELVPGDPVSCRLAVRYALEKVHGRRVETRWADAGALNPPEWLAPGDAPYAGGTVLTCAHRVLLRGTAREVWPPVGEIGGERGWYYGDLLWKIRGWMDRLAGGSGLRRGRRHPEELLAGEALDFWRVLDVAPPRRLLLLAEMKLPGEATLEFRVDPVREGEVELSQISSFRPRGLWGIAYWYALYPVHVWLFRGMLRALAGRAGRAVLRGPERFRPDRVPPAAAG